MPTPYEVGNPESKILVLGEAPAKVEMRLGEPLVGPSGEVFNECLNAAGIARRNCYILNVFEGMVYKDRAGNFWDYDSPRVLDDHKWWDAKTGFTDAGLRAAEPALQRIRASSANVIVTLGAQAMELVTGMVRAPMMKWRGSMLAGHERVNGTKCIPTIHPAATLHGTYLWRYMIINDFERAKEEQEYPDLRLPERTLLIDPSHKDSYMYIREARETGRFATDIEVINHQVSCFSISTKPSEAMTIPIRDEYGKSLWSEEQEASIWLEYAGAMGDENCEKINQNLIGFDAPFLLQQNHIHTRGFMGDTMIAQHIMYPEFPRGLDFICSVHTREPYYKDEGKMWKGMGGDIETFWRYCAKDSATALEAWDVLAQEMTDGGYWPTYEMTAKLADPLMFMTAKGVQIDTDSMRQLHGTLNNELDAFEKELNEIAEHPFNPASPKQCADYFYTTKGIAPYKNRSGGITTDDKAMARIVRRYNLPEARLVQKIRAHRKLISVSMEVKLDEGGILRCSWNPRGTWTGRLSSSKTIFGTGMNFQNMDPRFKQFIIAG